MHLNKHMHKVILNKRNLFKNKLVIIAKTSELSYFYKKIYHKNYKQKFFFDFFYLYRKFEKLTGFTPLVSYVLVKVKNKKKKQKIKKKNYITIKSIVFSKKFDDFFSYFFINRIYIFINVYKKIKFTHLYLQEFLFKKKNNVIFFNKNCIYFKLNTFFKMFKNLKFKKFIKLYKKKNLLKNFNTLKLLTLQFSFYSDQTSVMYHFLERFLLNDYKINFFLYKYFKNKVIKL